MQMFCKFKSKLLKITKINFMQKVKEKKKTAIKNRICTVR